jgi:hypothetical protein
MIRKYNILKARSSFLGNLSLTLWLYSPLDLARVLSFLICTQSIAVGRTIWTGD